MIKKAVLMVFATMLIVFGASIAYANQVDGMASNLGPALPSGAVLQASVNSGGTGDALIYGYYNARDSFSYIRVLNTSETTAIKARVRFREAKRSKEILDFNICLSNKDEWSAMVYTPKANGPAFVLPLDDDTKTAPAFPTAGQPFFYSATATIAGLEDVTADDTREGYLEILVTNAKGGGSNTTDVEWSDSECTNATAHTMAPNSIAGNMFILNANGAYSYNAAAISDCGLAVDYPIANETPTFNQCLDTLVGIDYILTKQSHSGMYNVKGLPFHGQTEMVITFPTKSLHGSGSSWTKPFNTVDAANCEPVTVDKYDSEEHTVTTSTGFSPSGSQGPALCNEVNVIKVGSSNITDSNVSAALDITDIATPTMDGWVKVGLDTGTIDCSSGNSVCLDTVQSYGLPSLGYVLQTYQAWMSGADSTLYNTVIGPAVSAN